MTNTLTVPVLLLVFNRPDTTRRVFDSIKATRPKKLYIAQDWPRHEKDKALIDEVREILQIDRDCDVKYLYRETNLGCLEAVKGGISWFFSQEDFWIILEDDCIMSPYFPEFCYYMNIHYKDNQIIWTISGSNYDKNSHYSYPYFFTHHHPLLRWRATWKNRWEKYSEHLPIEDEKSSLQWYRWLHYWDNHWYNTCRTYQRLTIVPSNNMITNIWHIWIHNQRPWPFHDIPLLTPWTPLHTITRVEPDQYINVKYDILMIAFITRLYIFTTIENILKKIGIYTIIHKWFLLVHKFFYKIWVI